MITSCASIDKDKPYFYTLEISADYKIAKKYKSFGVLKPQPPNGHFRYWVYNSNGAMIYKGVFPHNHICLPDEENHVEIKQIQTIRIPANSKRIRILTHDLQDITTITVR